MLQKSFFAVCIIWAVCFVLHIGFEVNPDPLIWICGISLLAWVLLYVYNLIRSRAR